jgi:hypothetical protein
VTFDRPDFMENVLLQYTLAVGLDLDLADNESVKAWVLEPGAACHRRGQVGPVRSAGVGQAAAVVDLFLLQVMDA